MEVWRKEEEEDLCSELLRAAARGDTERVEWLLLAGVSPRYAEAFNWTAFVLACKAGHLDTAVTVLKHGGGLSSVEMAESLREGTRGDHIAVVRMLLAQGADPSVYENWAVRWAANCGSDKILELFLSDQRVDPGADHNYCLCASAEFGHHKVVELLLRDPRVDPAARQNFAIRFAALNGHYKVVELLLRDPRVDPATRNCGPARYAARNGHCGVLKLLLERVDGTAAIPTACSEACRMLMESESCGMGTNRALFEQHHGGGVARFDELSAERTARVHAVSWAMKQIGDGWNDLREPTEERMQRQPLSGWDQ